MKDWSRRNVLRATAGAAIAVPMVALGGVAGGREPDILGGVTTDPAGGAIAGGGPDAYHRVDPGPVMFCVHDAARGEVSILHGGSEVLVHDRQLVARILQAARVQPAPAAQQA